MKIHFFGTSAGVATPRRFNTSILLENKEEEGLLLDCGEPASALLIRGGIPPESVTALVLSHLHSDHAGGFFQLIQTFQLLGRKRPFTVFMPSEGIEAFRLLQRTMYLFDSILPFDIRYIPIVSGRMEKAGDFILDFRSNEHLACYREISKREHNPVPCESFCVAVEADGKRVVYSGDIKHTAELEELLSRKTSLLISELVHFPPEEFAALPDGMLPEKIIFTHYKNCSDGTPLDLGNPVLAPFAERISFANDGEEEVL